ncbi:MAG: 4-(cytidine 5'-diphospho)-2-C-methyl-D-erythritol kinase [Candidatus Omnitrophota bacterium]|nr:4-(cytidine 5'-diphospho)-2-C-methyl-D-erythritol kinase [Candidatus Omnitrophota bacterium]MBU1894667.1 4-(cytidine 5'-diphospho)-2-C-methyl-D-erythritol kinase [Candidatus Omnitrophota bacterium]
MLFTAPAKVNLYLKIISRREDGYHNIETLFEKIALCDKISIEKAEKNTRIVCSDLSIPTDKNSLLGRAVTLFKEKAEISDNFLIKIKKNIPVSAGLGGGSSDAATVLQGLNEVTGNLIEKHKIVEMGKMLGADVPFFLGKTSFAYGRERGDKVEELQTELKMWHILVSPPFGISTKEVYQNVSAFGLTKNRCLDRMFSAFLGEKNIVEVGKNLHNDLQTIVLRRWPVLEKVFLEIRKTKAEGVLLSGTGSTIFGIYKTENDASSSAEKLCRVFRANENWRVEVATTY